jgi:ElaB/YqjD/DUF883 family membrane-anchored ribosome-binding protein
MRNNPTSLVTQVADEVSTLGGKIADSVDQTKEKVTDLGRRAVEKIDENRVAAAGRLEMAASSLHSGADSILSGGEKASGVAHSAADKLGSTAEYVRENNVNRMISDVGSMIKNNPGPALVAATVIGFLAGRASRSNHQSNG